MDPLLIGGIIIVAGAIVIFVLKKKKDKPADPIVGIPAPQHVKIVSWGDAGFADAISYAKWSQRNAFPKSQGPPVPTDIPFLDLNHAHNTVMQRMTYVSQPGQSYENDPPYMVGDCEEFALSFRSELIAMGYPVSCMRIAHGLLYNGNWHAFLCVWTHQGLWVLDQRKVKPWPYVWGGYSQTGFEAGDQWGYFHQI